jgi:hypothetical protein
VHEQLHRDDDVELPGRRLLRVPHDEHALGHLGGGPGDGGRIEVDPGHAGSPIARRPG